MLFTITLLTLWASLSVFFKVGAICFGSCCPLLRLQNFCGYRVNIPALCESRDPRSCIGQLCDDAQFCAGHVRGDNAIHFSMCQALLPTFAADVTKAIIPENGEVCFFLTAVGNTYGLVRRIADKTGAYLIFFRQVHDTGFLRRRPSRFGF